MTTSGQVGLLRRLSAVLYDLLPLFALLGITTFPWLLISGDSIAPGTTAYQLYLAFWVALYFLVSWRLGGQTIGMRAWRIRVVDLNGAAPTWQALSLRLGMSALSWLCLGLGFLSALWVPGGLTWHDRMSGTRLVMTQP